MRVAAIDIGSNSTRLLVADVGRTGVVPCRTDLETTRLGQGMSMGILETGAMERTIAVVSDFMEQARRDGAGKIVLAATSAVRDAANRDQFTTALLQVTGQQLLILSGPEEARLVYKGVVQGCQGVDAPAGLVVDIGGGSTELIWPSGGVTRYVSVQAGAVRMTEGGYGQGQVRRVLGDIMGTIREDKPGIMIGVGGTITTLAAMAQELDCYDSSRVHGFKLTRRTVDSLWRRLVDLTPEQRRKLPGLQPARADIIPAGTWILSRIMHELKRDVVLVSEADLLYGLVLVAAGVQKLSE